MDKMPDEVLLHIFSKLSFPDLISGARLTCWRWNRLSKDSSLWTNLDLCLVKFSQDTFKFRTGVRSLLCDIQDSLERLTFSNLPVDGGTYELFGSAWKHKNKAKFKKLKSLDYSYSDVSARNLRVALTTHPDIEELYLAYTKIPFSQVVKEAIHLPNLKKLVYHDSKSRDHISDLLINKLNVLKVPKHCQLLEVVELHTILADLDGEVIQQFVKYCTKLKRLSFNWSTNLTADAFTSLNTSMHHITELGLLERQETGPFLNFVLPSFPCLTQLTVSGQNIHLEDCIAIGECCPKLQELVFEMKCTMHSCSCSVDSHLYLYRDNSLCGLELHKIIEKCKDLRKLHAPFSNIDDDSVIFLAEECLFLEDVNFTHCHRLTKDSVFAFSKHSLCLKRINYQDTLIDHRYLLGLVRKCHKLEELIFDCNLNQSSSTADDITQPNNALEAEVKETLEIQVELNQSDDIPFIDMTESADEFELQHDLLKRLSDKDFGNSSHNDSGIGDNSYLLFPESVQHSPVKWRHCHLKKLSLKYSRAMGQYLQDIISECPDLTYVSLDGAVGLSDKLIMTLAKSCPNLRNLSVSSCALTPKGQSNNGFGDQGLLALTEYSHNLEILSFLYNKRITPVGLTALFHSLDTTLRSLTSVSLCVGNGYACNISVVALHGLKYLSEHSKQQLKDGACTTRGISFMVLHLDFLKRKCH